MSKRIPIHVESGEEFNITQHTLEEGLASPDMKKIRNEFLRGEKPSVCADCWKLESASAQSYRQTTGIRFPTSSSEENFDKPLYLDLALGNSCNLMCSMCHPESSRMLFDEHSKFLSQYDDREEFLSREYDWCFDEECWEKIFAVSESVAFFKFHGGEPLMVPSLFQFLKRLVDADMAAEKEIYINTNLTKLKVEHLKVLSQFKKSFLAGSIDGLGKVNEYVRYPSDWKNVLERWDLANDWVSNSSSIVLQLNCTVQIYNVFDLLEFLYFFIERYDVVPNLSLVRSPKELSLVNLPESAKKEIVDSFTQVDEERLGVHSESVKMQLGQIASFMNSQAGDMRRFWKRTDFFDQQRKLSAEEWIPGLKALRH